MIEKIRWSGIAIFLSGAAILLTSLACYSGPFLMTLMVCQAHSNLILGLSIFTLAAGAGLICFSKTVGKK